MERAECFHLQTPSAQRFSGYFHRIASLYHGSGGLTNLPSIRIPFLVFKEVCGQPIYFKSIHGRWSILKMIHEKQYDIACFH